MGSRVQSVFPFFRLRAGAVFSPGSERFSWIIKKKYIRCILNLTAVALCIYFSCLLIFCRWTRSQYKKYNFVSNLSVNVVENKFKYQRKCRGTYNVQCYKKKKKKNTKEIILSNEVEYSGDWWEANFSNVYIGSAYWSWENPILFWFTFIHRFCLDEVNLKHW